MVRTTSVNYKKIRPLHVLCQLELCRHAIRYGCQREDSCDFAHSVIELKTWKVQQATGTNVQWKEWLTLIYCLELKKYIEVVLA